MQHWSMLVKTHSNKQIFSSIISENGLFSIRKMKTIMNFVKVLSTFFDDILMTFGEFGDVADFMIATD